MNIYQRALRLVTVAGLLLASCLPGLAATEPVRIALVAASTSGIEQELVDMLTTQLQNDPNIVISTVNPDWYVSCHIVDQTDIVAMTVRVNGTVSVKTAVGDAVLNTISAQVDKQDYSASGPSPLNKTLVTNAIREVIDGLSHRAVIPIEQAVATEMDTRVTLNQAKAFANQDKYDQALTAIETITRDSPHFFPAQKLANQYQIERESLTFIARAKSAAASGRYKLAISDLRQVDCQSKRYRMAQALASSYSHATLAKNKSASVPRAETGSNPALKALEAQKRALDAQRAAVEAEEKAIKPANDKP